MESTIKSRGHKALNLEDFNAEIKPELIGGLDLKLPSERQYVLRILIKRPFEDMQVPEEMKWCQPFIDMAVKAQEDRGIRQPFMYLTIRHGKVSTKTDDVWHVDGFSQTITHLPEQNYVWCSHTPTEYVVKPIRFSPLFDSARHNIHDYFSHVITDSDEVKTLESKSVYAMDPYIIHRRPKIENDDVRTFLRVSFTPIEINDVNNTFNPNMPTNYKRDGRSDFRDKLVSYHEESKQKMDMGLYEMRTLIESGKMNEVERDFLISQIAIAEDEYVNLFG